MPQFVVQTIKLLSIGAHERASLVIIIIITSRSSSSSSRILPCANHSSPDAGRTFVQFDVRQDAQSRDR